MELALNALQVLLGLVGALYLLGRCSARFFMNYLAINNDNRPSGLGTAWSYTKLTVYFVGTGVFLYHGASAFLELIPASWMERDEYGDVTGSTREYLQFLFALVGSAAVMSSSEKQAEKLDRLATEELKRRGFD